MDLQFKEDGYKIFRGYQHVFKPVRLRLESLFLSLFPSCPSIENIEDFAYFLTDQYQSNREEVLKVYDVFDRTFEMLRASSHPDLLQALSTLGLEDPIVSSYPTWRLDLSNNPPSRWFPWHQDNYHEFFSDNSVTVWSPLHLVGAQTKNSTLFFKKGSHANGVYKYGKNKFDIVDQRIHEFPEVTLDLNYGDFVAFNSSVVHRSGVITEAPGLRLSLQFRYDDLKDAAYKKKGWPRNFKFIDAISHEKYGI